MLFVVGEGRELARPPGARTELDLAAVEHLDGAAAALLLDLRHELAAKGGDVEIVGPPARCRPCSSCMADRREPSQKLPPTRIGILDQIGRETLAIFGESHHSTSSGHGARDRAAARRRER